MGIVQDTYDMTGRVAIITGAARGLGKAAATLLADVGAHVVIVDNRAELAAATAAELRAAGYSADSAEVDVSKRLEVDALVADVLTRHGRLWMWSASGLLLSPTRLPIRLPAAS